MRSHWETRIRSMQPSPRWVYGDMPSGLSSHRQLTVTELMATNLPVTRRHPSMLDHDPESHTARRYTLNGALWDWRVLNVFVVDVLSFYVLHKELRGPVRMATWHCTNIYYYCKLFNQYNIARIMLGQTNWSHISWIVSHQLSWTCYFWYFFHFTLKMWENVIKCRPQWVCADQRIALQSVWKCQEFASRNTGTAVGHVTSNTPSNNTARHKAVWRDRPTTTHNKAGLHPKHLYLAKSAPWNECYLSIEASFHIYTIY